MTKRELLLRVTKKDFTIQAFQAGGKGGQHQNKTSSGVRIIHQASGARGESRSERSQLTNKKLALKRLSETTKFKLWLTEQVMIITEGKTIDQRIEEQMRPENLLIETVGVQGQWKLENT